jgi:hypothetical protein
MVALPYIAAFQDLGNFPTKTDRINNLWLNFFFSSTVIAKSHQVTGRLPKM